MNNDCIEFTVSEQNALAYLCERLSSISHTVHSVGSQPSERQIDDLLEVVDRFESINWSDLYDRFHRSGKNS